MSLVGYIAGQKGESDWITMDPDVDFSSLFNQFDTILVGRGAFESIAAAGGAGDARNESGLVFANPAASRLPRCSDRCRGSIADTLAIRGWGALS